MASIIKVDEIKEKTQGSGITLGHSLKNSSGTEILSPSGTVSNLSKLSLTPSTAPSNPVHGDMYLDSSDNKLKIYTGNSWVTVVNASPSFAVEYLVVAGGGSGGADVGGGGGAGGYRCSVSGEFSGGSSAAESMVYVNFNILYTITVGPGGTSVGAGQQGNDGNPSTFSNIISNAGGGGGNTGGTGNSGGSGGGGGRTGSGGSETSNQGYAGGNGSGASTTSSTGGGGGGAGEVGQNGVNSLGGRGGNGLTSLITGSSITRGGGGGGGIYNGTQGSGGSGGGATGGRYSNVGGSSGTANTGGGGGGGGANGGDGGAGGSGIVVISYSDTYDDLQTIHPSHVCNGQSAGSTNAPAPSTARAGYKTYIFTAGDGNISW